MTRVAVPWRALVPPPFIGRMDARNGCPCNVRRLCSKILWRNMTTLQRTVAALLIALWPLGAIVSIYPQTRRYAEGVRQELGKSRSRQVLDMLSLILRHRVSPKHYYRFRLYQPDLRRQAGEFLLRNQLDGFIYSLLQRPEAAKSQPLSNKMKFARHCQANGLPHVPTLMHFVRGRCHVIGGDLDGRDLFVKPVRGSRGAGAERWNYGGGGTYRSTRGRELDKAALLRRIAKLSHREPLLVQPAFRNHPAILDLTSGGLWTMRLVTWRNESDAIEVTDAIIRTPVDPAAAVDNTHAGGITAPIDIATGQLGRAADMGERPEIVWHDVHPVTGGRITGRRLPYWHEAIELAKRAHEAFDLHLVIGWDIALLGDGLCIIEGNERPGASMQHDAGVPWGNRRFGALVAHHLRPYLGVAT